MAPAWRDRRAACDALLEELEPVLDVDAHAPNAPSDVARRDLLLDLAASKLGRVHGRAAEVLRLLSELRLDAEADFEAVDTLVRSSCSKVDVVRSALAPGALFVRKSVDKAFASRMRGQMSPHHERSILVLAQSPSCEYIPRLLGALQTSASLYLFLELVPCGTIGDLLEAQSDGSGLPERWVVHWTAQTIEALEWLHAVAGFAHRDVKPGNMLLRSDGHVLLTDFGSAAPIDRASRRVDALYCRTPAGTVDYMAPDILIAHQAALAIEDGDEPDGAAIYGVEVDYWSLGSTVYEMLYWACPFFAPSIPETYDRIFKHARFLSFPDVFDVSDDAVDLIGRLLCSADKRYGRNGIDELRQHALFSEVAWGSQTRDPAPYIPAIHLLDVEGGGEVEQPAAFNFSAFFASPGLSILQADDVATRPPVSASNDWLGFTCEPTVERMADPAFARATSLVMPPPGESDTTVPSYLLRPYETPAPLGRRRSSLLLEGQSTIKRPMTAGRKSASKSRSMTELAAWRAVVDVGAARSAQRRRRTPARSRSPELFDASPSSSITLTPAPLPAPAPAAPAPDLTPALDRLHLRHHQLMETIATLEDRHAELCDRLRSTASV